MTDSTAKPKAPSAATTIPTIRLGLWCALVFGLVEGVWMTVERVALGHFTMTGIHVVWLAPLMDVVWFTLLGLLLLLAFVLRPAGPSLTTVLRVYLTFGFFSLSLLFGGLHRMAGLVLSLGLAVEATRFLARHADGVRALASRTLAPLVALLALAAGMAFVTVRFEEQRAIARGGVAPAGAPNVLLLIMDTVRDLDLSVSGYPRPTTPNLERFAAGGVRFARAWSPSSWTLSSHASMFTGLLPHQLSAGLNTALDNTHETIAERLAARGWLTAGFVGNQTYAGRDYGLNRGFQHYEDYILSPGELLLNSSVGRYLATRRVLRRITGSDDVVTRRHAADLNGRLLRWLPTTGRRPFFAFVNYFDAHEPYIAPAAFEQRFASKVTLRRFVTDLSVRGARRVDKPHMSPAEIARMRDSYDAAIAWEDAAIGALLDSLRARGLLANTLVIIASDHGEQFGEHGLFVHGNSLYRPVLKVPLIVSMPGRIPAGTVIEPRVNLRNLAATIAELTHVDDVLPMPGRSLAAYWEHRPVPDQNRPMVFEVEANNGDILRSVVVNDLQYIRHRDGREELIALPNDSVIEISVRHHQALDSSEPMVRSLSRQLDSILRATGPDRWGP